MTAAEAAVHEAMTLVQEFVTPDVGLIDRAYQLREGIRVRDGIYVALAERLRCPLLTSDKRLAAAHLPCTVVVPAS
ncbi:hypothetical protein ET475_11270 [Microbacterium protaetiae]|uniref:PIN domain-containing protein n=1 Tax=Microbacterium protaetiae TaxID=2509458 RepID=A0A4P6EE05_9MICO|nr:type II toxin-antitoxin system VapC family toxin [Microbacterium protaetiae]QAY60512.1 hypothetical protein ET475_11270 [Microbacterium protaetiae]